MATAFRLTERDLVWLAWLGRWRCATANQVAREFTMRGQSAPLKVVQRRLRAAATLGLVESATILADVPRLHWLTREGMNAAGLAGAVVHPKLAELHHDLTVIDVAAWLAEVRPTHTIRTEREIRRDETPNQHETPEPVFALRHDDARSVNSRVYPDLVSISPNGARWGHEVETARKDRRRLVRLMLAYCTAPTYRGARYYASQATYDTVARAAQEANAIARDRGLGDRIMVATWPPEGATP